MGLGDVECLPRHSGGGVDDGDIGGEVLDDRL